MTAAAPKDILGTTAGERGSLPKKAPVAQLDRASDFESAGRPFESDRARHYLCEVYGSPEFDTVRGRHGLLSLIANRLSNRLKVGR